MAVLEKLNVGIVGACGRGASFKSACDALAMVRLHAVCDINRVTLEADQKRLGAKESYVDYQDMLSQSDLDAVVIATPMPLHVLQAIAAMERGIHVLSEVPAGVSIEECQLLVKACKHSKATYMMAENYTYRRHCMIVRQLVLHGAFGTPYYAEGEYIHELKKENEITKWRRKWQNGINGITYGTHSLGPILQWMPGERVTSVCCVGSGRHHRDASGKEFENEAPCVMLCKMKSGGLVKIRVDMLSDRPHAMHNYQLQGTDACFESARTEADKHRIWLRTRCKDVNEWIDLESLADEFLPDWYKQSWEEATQAGHGGGDYFEVLDFVASISGERLCPIGIHEAMDMTLPGLCSQESILHGSDWIDVPDSRSW